MRLFIYRENQFICRSTFFLWKGSQKGPRLGPVGPRPNGVGPKQEKNIYFFPMVRAPAGALKVYRENQCVIFIFEINAYFVSLKSMRIKCIDFRDSNNCLFLP